MCVRSKAKFFYDTSYASPGILEKLKWICTRAMDKKAHRDQALIMEEWDNIHDPILKTKPKSLREATYERMKQSTSQQSLAYKIWFCGLLQYMVPFVHYFPELVHECMQHFNPDTGTFEGWELRVVISVEDIRDMLCIHSSKGYRAENMETFTPEGGEEFWKTRDLALSFYDQETKRPKEDFKKSP